MSKKDFTKEYLKEELELPWNDDLVQEDKITDTSRWSVIHDLIFKDPADGKFYATYYSIGATENQDESPWEYGSTIECNEVELKEVIVKQWVSVDTK